MADPTLTALVITYNHAPFIEEALEGVFMQETDFEYEVVISEDCSTDGTRAIIERYARAHPDRVRLLLSPYNLNDNSVIRRGIAAARGRYLALLDGDDAWTAKDKLQTQVDFLESRPDCAMCFHNARVVYEDRTRSHLFHQADPTPVSTLKPKPLSTLEDIVRATFIPTCSAVFRTEHIRELPDWYDGLAAGDRPLHVLAAEHGYLAFIDEVMANYRVHAGGIWTARAQYRELADVEAVVEVYDAINRHLGFEYDGIINKHVGDIYRTRAHAFYEAGDYESARTSARRALRRLSRRPRAKAQLLALLARANLARRRARRA